MNGQLASKRGTPSAQFSLHVFCLRRPHEAPQAPPLARIMVLGDPQYVNPNFHVRLDHERKTSKRPIESYSKSPRYVTRWSLDRIPTASDGTLFTLSAALGTALKPRLNSIRHRQTNCSEHFLATRPPKGPLEQSY